MSSMRIAGTAALAVGLAAALAGCGSDPVPAPGPSVGTQVDAALPASVLEAPLVSADGRRVRLAQFKDKVVVVSDVMTLCQETCPLDTANVVAAARKVQKAGLGDKVEFVSITVDPGRDTPARLAAYRELYAPAPADWLTLTGSPATIGALWHTLGVYIQKVPDEPPLPTDWLTGQPLTYDITHSDELFFLGPQQHEKFVLEGAPQVAKGAPIPPAILKFMDDQGRNNIAHPDPLAWTLPQELQVVSWLADHRVAAT